MQDAIAEEQKPVMADRRSSKVLSSFKSPLCLPFPRFAGVTVTRYLLLGAKTPWNLVRLTLGFGTSEANFDIKSKGSNMTWVVPGTVNLTVSRSY